MRVSRSHLADENEISVAAQVLRRSRIEMQPKDWSTYSEGRSNSTAAVRGMALFRGIADKSPYQGRSRKCIGGKTKKWKGDSEGEEEFSQTL